MASLKLRDVLLPKPFVGVLIWALALVVATELFLTRFVRNEPSMDGVRGSAAMQTPNARTESGAKSEQTSPSHVATPTAVDEAGATRASESRSESSEPVPERHADDSRYQMEWPDRTHEVVVHKNEFMTDQREGYRLGAQGDPRLPGVTVTVTQDTFGPDNDLTIVVSKADEYNSSRIELKTARREKRIHARVWAHGHVYPQAPPEWLDVSGQATINTWIWPEVKPVVIAYTLSGVRQGMRHTVSDTVIVDF